ncbi:hypothetical protein C8Q76DRAFT_82462 [Earliella scabrosa]|nr:hypothetical protein C8Q76DRAFT_82462 [Earliella scabrosa]
MAVMSAHEQDVEIVAIYNENFVANLLTIASAALYMYEYLVTFLEEVNLFWRKPWTGASILFYTNRYTVLAYHTFNLGSFSLVTDSVTGIQAIVAVEALQYIPWAGFSALRSYALCRNRVLSALIFFLSMVLFFITAGHIRNVVGMVIPPYGCVGGNKTSPSIVLAYCLSRCAER